jgi:hypothetical protein
MQKTTTILLPKKGTENSVQQSATEKQDVKQAEPSRQTIQNILNYSKALRVEKSDSISDYIEYLGN